MVVSRNAHAKLVRNEVEVSTIAGVALPVSDIIQCVNVTRDESE